MKKHLFSILALLLMAAGGAVAQTENTASVRQLTRNAEGNWVLDQMPDFDGVLQATFYEQFRLDSIPLSWTITVNDVDRSAEVTAYTEAEGPDTLGWLMVHEGAAVKLVPPTVLKPKVKSVKLMEALRTIDLATVTADITVEDGYTVIGTLGANVKISIADGATVTLDGVTINGENDSIYSWAGITCLGDATIILSGTDTVKGFLNHYPGIYVPQNKTVTIQGSGSLTARSNGMGCGIGGGFQIACGNIVIAGGTITATGGTGAAGIGGGYKAGCGNISITGGTVTANGGAGAAGIGGGIQASCGNITITDGVTSVTATKGNSAPYSIGAGNGGQCGTVTIGDVTGAISQSPYIYPAPVVLTLDLATVTTDTTVGDGDTLTGTLGANVKISIADGATVTLDGVTINGVYNTSYRWAGITCLGDATIILSGTNTVKGFYDEYPGIYVPQNKTLTIEGSGSLTASSNGYGCGIGGGYQITCGNIVIAGGNITATGGNQAGIGGGYHGSCGNISITGGTITATGGNSAAGIGSGQSGSCGNISITGGTITATGGNSAAGIGSGNQGQCGTVTITNGVTSLTATKGNSAQHSIGAGLQGSCGTVTIGGTTGAITTSPYTYPAPAVPTLDLATVTTDTTVGDGYTLTGTLGANVKISIADGATVTLDGVTINGVKNNSYPWAGITCLGDATIILSGMDTVKGFHEDYPGIYVPVDKTVTIEGSGSLTASSNGYACGIGGGYQIACGNIVIAGGTITANGGTRAAGIGGGYQIACGNIVIAGGNITATGGSSAAGIGGGRQGSCGNISITSGTVNANGGENAAGIGSGANGSCGTVTITNGVTSVTATKGNDAIYSIGAGASGSCGTVTIGGATGEIDANPYTYPQN